MLGGLGLRRLRVCTCLGSFLAFTHLKQMMFSAGKATASKARKTYRHRSFRLELSQIDFWGHHGVLLFHALSQLRQLHAAGLGFDRQARPSGTNICSICCIGFLHPALSPQSRRGASQKLFLCILRLGLGPAPSWQTSRSRTLGFVLPEEA